ncbi:unnamed protein product, partial [Iphiclides podalirius]
MSHLPYSPDLAPCDFQFPRIKHKHRGVDQGEVIYTKDGSIYLFQYLTTVDIPVPNGVTVTYVKITVTALSPPKVDYDNLYHRVTIKYSWTQISQSSYNIIVKGVKV